MTKRTGAFLIVWLTLAIALGAWANHKWPSDPYGNPTCQKDQSCWDCHTMGNKICGPGKN